MIYPDENNDVVQHSEIEGKAALGDTESVIMPKIEPAPRVVKQPVEDAAPSENMFFDNLITALFKTLFLALSLIAMLSCIIALSLPLQTMRLFNSWGMSARAVDFGDRYISRETKKYGADVADERGNMLALSSTEALTNDDFVEALYVCTTLSDRLMMDALKSGDTEMAEYYAERLEKYTRMHLSLNSLSAVSLKTDAKNIASVPAAVRSVVYSYEHDMRVLNYKARSVLGQTNYIPYNTRSNRVGIITDLYERWDHFVLEAMPTTVEGITARLDDFVDYVGQLGAYLDVEFVRLGVETDLSTKKYALTNGVNVSVLNETIINRLYGQRLLDGDEFALFIMPLSEATKSNNGFTTLYYRLTSIFTRHAQLAVDTVPREENGRLHQLYWLNVLSSVSRKLWYMEMLLYFNTDKLGVNKDAVLEEYGALQRCMFVNYELLNGVPTSQLSEVYAAKLTQYLAN